MEAETLLHETSHFAANGGTNDYAYGQSAAKSLATSDPARAVMNADLHECVLCGEQPSPGLKLRLSTCTCLAAFIYFVVTSEEVGNNQLGI